MKSLLNSMAITLLAVALFSCSNSPKGEKVEGGEAQQTMEASKDAAKYTVDVEQSSISWAATKLMGGGHNGTLKMSEGAVFVSKDQISGGNFSLDMTSIENVDLTEKPGMKEKLEGHLKNSDFFEVDTHPTGSFEITGVEAVSGDPNTSHRISGNLTLKGITKSVNIPAKVSVENGQLTAITSEFNINRTEWDIKYRSGLLGTPKDKMINDDVNLQISLVARK